MKDKGQLDEAIAVYRRAIALKPIMREPLAISVTRARGEGASGRGDRRRSCPTIALKPDFAEMHSNPSAALRDKGLQNEAIAACRQAIALRPNFPEAYTNLGNALVLFRTFEGE